MIDEAGRTRVVAAAGVELSVVERPVGAHDPDRPGLAPVLLVHGLASNARMWDGVAQDLARRGHRSVAVDQRGHGRSDTPDDGYDFPTLVADLVAVMDAMGLRRPIVAGQSWGADVVLELGVRHPDRLAGVVCVDGAIGAMRDSLPDWSTAERALTPPDLVGTPVAVLEHEFRVRHPDWPESGIVGALANFRVRDDGTVEPWLARSRHMTIARHLWEHDPLALYRRLQVPAALLVADGPVPSATRQARVDAITAQGTHVQVLWFRPGDHDLHAQFPDRVAAVIARFAQDAGEDVRP